MSEDTKFQADKESLNDNFLSAMGALMAVLGIPFTILIVLGLGYITLGGLGPETIYVNVHYGLFIALLFLAAFVLDAVFFAKPSAQAVQMILFASFFLFVMTIALDITGIIPDVPMSTGAAVSGTYATAFGNYTASVSDAALGSFTGPLFFDMMEHVSLLGPAIAAVLTGMVWHYKGLVLTEPEVKRSVLILMTIAIAWMLILATMGVILVKTLTFPPGV